MAEEINEESLENLTGTEKSAILMMLLGEDEAAQVLQKLTPREVQHLGTAMYSVTGVDQTTMVKEGQKLSKIAPNVVIKVPLTMEGLKACKTLSDEKISVNVTLCFNAAQAILAAKAGATYISPFIGRLDDIGADGMNLISEIVEIYNIYNFKTEVLAASIRGVQDVVDSAKFGADIATIPTNILRSMYLHPLTDKGLDAFLSDWAKTGQSIL